MSATTAAPQINRKQTRTEVDGQIQKSIPMFLQAALRQCFERMSHALRWGDVSLRDDPLTDNVRLFLKVSLFAAIAVILRQLPSNDLVDFNTGMKILVDSLQNHI